MVTYDVARKRRLLKSFMDKQGLKILPWCTAAGVTEGTLRSFLKGRTQTLTDETYDRLAQAAGVPPAVLRGETLPRQHIKVVHKVGAGAEVIPIDDHERGQGLDDVEAPPDADERMLAARVEGDSMLPAYRPGDVIFYRRDDSDWRRHVGREVVVQLADGRCFVKLLKRATKTTANLGSHNAADIDGVRVDWAAPVLWIKRGG